MTTNLMVVGNNATETITGSIVITLEGFDYKIDQASVGISMTASEREIIDSIAPIIREEKGVDISSGYKVRKALNSETIYVIPNSTAG